MNSKTILYAVAAFVGAAALFKLGRGSGVLVQTGDAQRLSGVDHLYASDTGQNAGFQKSIEQSWKDLQQSVFQTQPDFWV